MNQMTKFAKSGNHRHAQAYNKLGKRAMGKAVTEEQMAVKRHFTAHTTPIY